MLNNAVQMVEMKMMERGFDMVVEGFEVLRAMKKVRRMKVNR